jgi:hypothetical protein
MLAAMAAAKSAVAIFFMIFSYRTIFRRAT